MIARAPILAAGAAGVVDNLEADGPFADSFLTDRVTVWEKLMPIFQNHESWTYIKQARKAKNGRIAYRLVYAHYLGPNNVDHLAGKAENRLRSMVYCGETRKWNFERYVTEHKEQHIVLQNLEEYGYKGIDDRSKVRHLNDGIKAENLTVIKSTILASATLRSDFDGCVTLYKDFIQQSDLAPEAKIAGVQTGDKSGGGSDSVVEDRYYKGKEYKQLSKDQKDAMREMRRKHKGGGGGGSSKG